MKRLKANRNSSARIARLVISRETVAILAGAELTQVIGGASAAPACTSSDDDECTKTK